MKLRPALLLLSAVPLLAVPSSFAWGNKGHRIISRLAAESLPAYMPAFMRTPEAISEIEYLGPEPDRWRSRAEPELNAAQAPDHFIDIEYADLIGTLPRQRYEYIAALYSYIASHPDRAADLRPEKVGFQPYITSEVWERLKSAMRDYRELSAKHEATRPVEAAILFYAGWLSHYVADGSQPLHVTIQYNGWTGPNPNGYTTEHHIHSLFESTFVDAAIHASDVQPLMTPLHPINDEWDDYLAYLRHTGSLTEQVYQFEKAHALDGTGTEESRHFTAERLAAGASMLRDLYVAAWQNSADPVPEWHDQHAPSVANSTTTAGTPASGSSVPSPSAANPPDSPNDVPYSGKIYHPGGGVSLPKLESKPEPIQIGSATGNRSYQGIDVIGLVVDDAGHPRNLHIVRPLGMGLDEKAMQAVRQYVFSPAIYRGKPVAVEVNIEVEFQIYSSDSRSPEH